MAITGYFIDKDWNYRETLLGFELSPYMARTLT